MVDLKKVSGFWRQEVSEVLNDEKRFQHLKQMLQGSSVMLESDGYQMCIRSIEELIELKEFLNDF